MTTAAAPLTARHSIVLDAYQRLAVHAIPAVEVDDRGDRWGVAVHLDDMWPMIVEEINGRDAVLAVVLDLAARTEGEFSSVVTDEFGETRIVFESGILGRPALVFEAHPETCECGCPTEDHDDLCDGTAECSNCMVLCDVEIV